ncbi:MAG: diacylglycerol kinase family protein [Novosphingobium sp.]
MINRSGGTAASLGDALAETITTAFAEAGARITLELLDADEMASALERHRGAPVIAVGGGDGTIASAAAVLANSLTALAILPLGTRNHLARQLGVPLDLAEAAQSSVCGQRRRIDLGMAGERVFINNASFGLYTRFVRQREADDRSYWRATLSAAWNALRNVRAQYFTLRVDGASSVIATPLLFIGNNEYSMRPGQLGRRESLTEHQLSLYAVAAKHPGELIGLATRALFGFAQPPRDFLEYGSAREVVIEGAGVIEGTFDGEVAVLSLPLRLRTLPNALGVVTPPENAEPERTLTRIH